MYPLYDSDIQMSLKRGFIVGVGALLGGGGGFWLQNKFINKHRHEIDNYIEEESSRRFRSYLAGLNAKPIESEHVNTIANYSGTHSSNPNHYLEPENLNELEKVVAEANKLGAKIRPVGRFLSPNGIAGCKGGMVSLGLCDRIVNIDTQKKQITVEAGAVVADVLGALEKHGLTLQNFSSIKEQQMGGWTQVGAHGTGARLSTVEDMITSLKLITPRFGTVTLENDASRKEERELFRMVRCGLGSLGIVSEMTLQCIDSHTLKEYTTVMAAKELTNEIHAGFLRNFRHVRYMWIPHTNQVVVVRSNPLDNDEGKHVSDNPGDDNQVALRPMQNLLEKSTVRLKKSAEIDITGMSFSKLRDLLIDLAPLDTSHIKKVNAAEAEFWKKSEGVREGKSNDLLGFDCGGQQWVLEMAFPTGTLENPKYADLRFVAELKSKLEEYNVPAPAPIEQRWTSSSSSYMSPAYSTDENAVFSWVGIIMYLPPGQDEDSRQKITEQFRRYGDIMEEIGEKYGAFPHWAKMDFYSDTIGDRRLEQLRIEKCRKQVRSRFDVERFNKCRKLVDPNSILMNHFIEKLFHDSLTTI